MSPAADLRSRPWLAVTRLIESARTRPRVRQLLLLMNAGALGVALSLLNSVLLVNLLGADPFGQYAYLIALTSIIPTFYETFNKSVVRFMGKIDARRQLRLLLFVGTAKTAVFFVVFGLFLGWLALFSEAKLDFILGRPGFRLVLVASLAALPVKLAGNVFRSVLNAHEQYRSVAALALLPTLAPVLINGALLINGASPNATLPWIALELVLTPTIALLVSLHALRANGWITEMRAVRISSFPKAFRFGYERYFRHYGQPLATSVIFQYVKQYLPLILLGQTSTFTNVAYYRVLGGIADLGTEFFPSVANSMLPSVVSSRERDPQRFAERFTRHGALYLALVGAAMLVFIVAHPLLFRLYDLELTRDASVAVLLVGLLILQAALGFLLNYLFMLSGDTRANYVMSPAHNIFYALAIVLMTPYLVVGMMIARLAHRAFGAAMLSYVTVARLHYLERRQYITLLGLTLGLSGLLILVYSWSAIRIG